ncbi:hypothetical protein [Streptomyces longisporus]
MRVLVVEDDDDLRFAVAAALRGGGLAVDEAGDLPAADEALVHHRLRLCRLRPDDAVR